jgi:hypothetical protein
MENLKELIDNNYGILICKGATVKESQIEEDDFTARIFKHPFVEGTISYMIFSKDLDEVMEALSNVTLEAVELSINNPTYIENED